MRKSDNVTPINKDGEKGDTINRRNFMPEIRVLEGEITEKLEKILYDYQTELGITDGSYLGSWDVEDAADILLDILNQQMRYSNSGIHYVSNSRRAKRPIKSEFTVRLTYYDECDEYGHPYKDYYFDDAREAMEFYEMMCDRYKDDGLVDVSTDA